MLDQIPKLVQGCFSDLELSELPLGKVSLAKPTDNGIVRGTKEQVGKL